ncbi:serine/threonine-protein kinase [Nonomuraea sediminis]|uniref:serine/threonine-protein kinase n=1 Tax=Nonomuraea sediminis TaxID=2835864 RepID=UPI001BDBB4E5|nr:serine/threonine-protein kinase [Nonomuraea sediminis]
MSDLSALRPGDPETVGEYALSGRLGEGGQGTVYLATAPDGAKVAVKLLRADLAGDHEASERFVREVALARRVAPFCTAQVVETGLVDGRPYIVSEYIDGPTLAEVVRTQGPRSGASLHRLAIGTVTALVAIHQAGIVHRDFKPSNVVLASDGPRVIDFGIARALDLTSTLTATAIGTPSFMAPEQLSEASPGPPADMFAWACTLLYAASGQPPFGHDSLPAVVNRIMNTDADVSVIADPALRGLVADCLAKDPMRRPSAGQALMRLLGHAPGAVTPPAAAPGLLAQGTAIASTPAPGHPSGPHGPASGPHGPASGQRGPVSGPHGPARPPGPSGPQGGAGPHGAGLGPHGTRMAQGPMVSGTVGQHLSGPVPPQGAPSGLPYQLPPPMRTQPTRKRPIGWIVAGAVTGALALGAAGTLLAVRLATLPTPSPTPTPTASTSTETTPTPTPTPTPSVPSTAGRTIALPGSSVRIQESDADPLKLVSYSIDSGKRVYVRHGEDFQLNSRYFEYALNSDGTKALATDVDYTSDHYAQVSVIDHGSGAKKSVKLSAAPIFPTTPRWSPDGKLGLVTLYKATTSSSVEYGYGIIDIEAGTGQIFEVKEKGAGEWRFFWDADGQSVGTWVSGKMKFFDLKGNPVRSLTDVGSPVWVEGDDVSPTGSRFLAHCTAGGESICVRPTSGDGTPVVVPFKSERLIGWWDDDHLAAWRAKGTGTEAVVIDLKGQVVKELATASSKTEFDKMGFRYSRGTP